jgi:hypothetical protein
VSEGLTYRDEVNEAVKAAIEKIADGIVERENGKLKLTGVQPALRELILLGVRLGLEAAAAELEAEKERQERLTDRLALHNARVEVLDIHPGYVLQVKP